MTFLFMRARIKEPLEFFRCFCQARSHRIEQVRWSENKGLQHVEKWDKHVSHV